MATLNTLDLFLTSNVSLVNTVSVHCVLPGIFDHDIVSAMVDLRPVIPKQLPCVMPLYSKADWTGFKAYAKEQCKEPIKDHPSKTVEELWSSFIRVIHNGIAN